MNSEFTIPSEAETTGRYIVTFREGASDQALAALVNSAGVRESNLLGVAISPSPELIWTRFPPRAVPCWAISAWP